MIDPSFTDEPADFSVTEDNQLGDAADKFEGFTYVAKPTINN